jgi:lipopolysaccharide/colanic/teichoic acid biosynthesis glycosyltransferase
MIYIKNYSLLLDVKIIMMTLGAMLPAASTVRKSANPTTLFC